MATTTKACPNLQKSLDWCEGRPVFPGIRRRIYYIAKTQILQWPDREKDEYGRYLDAKYKGDFVLAADAVWHYIDVLVAKSQLTSEAQGEAPSQTQLNKLVAVHPGTDAEATAAAAYINNCDNVYLVQDMPGAWRVLGSEMYQAKGTVAQDLGQGATGTASTTINVEATDATAAPFYYGKVVTESGSFNADGSPVTGGGGAGGGTTAGGGGK